MSKNTYLDLMKNKADKLNTVRFDHENEDQTVTLSYFDGEEWKELSNLGSGGGGGGGSLGKGSLTSTFNKSVIQVGEDVTIDYFYNSPNGNGVLYVILNNNQIVKQNIGQGGGELLIEAKNFQKGMNNLRIYVIDKAGTYTDSLTYNIACGTLEITCGFNSDRDYYPESNIVFQFNVDCVNDEPITFHITQNGKEVTDPYVVQKGWSAITFPKYGPGIYRVEMWCTTNTYISNKVSFVVYILAGDSLFISTTYDQEEVPEGETIKFDYRVSMRNQEYFDCVFYIDEQEKKRSRMKSGTDYWNISGLPMGGHELKIVASTVDSQYSAELVYNLTITESEYDLVRPVTTLLKAWFDGSTKSNTDSDKEIWTSKYPDSEGNYATATLHGFNFSSNGWINNTLKCDGSAYAEVDLTPFKNNVDNGGLTIDIVFETADVGNQDARVLDCTDLSTVAGCYIDTQYAFINTKGGTALKSAFSENVQTRVTYVIDRDSQYISKEQDETKNGKLCDNPMIQIYVNGVFSEIGYLADSRSGSSVYYENIDHEQKIYLNSRKGLDCFGSCSIRHLRIYERALTHEEVLQNHMADIENPDEQQALYRKNFDPDVMPVMRITTYGSMNPAYDFSKVTKENRIPCAISYQAIEKHGGSSFELDYCQIQWQGTSTIQYAVKNYKIRLYENGSVPIINGDTFDDSGAVKYRYKLFGDEESIGEYKFTLKADYMDSSMSHNTAMASFIGDNLYDTPIPPNKLEKRTRSCCKGYPFLLYIDGEYAGIYNFMIDKGAEETFGFEKPKDRSDITNDMWKKEFPCILAYEGSANSDNTAGAFNAWKPESGVDLNTWYANDFELRFPEDEHDSYAEVHRLVDFVDNSTDRDFVNKFDQYINREYCFRYFLNAYMMGCVDSLGKNLMLSTWDGKIWYFCWYDMDTCLGVDNSGYLKFEPDMEMEAGVYNTSESRLWTRLKTLFYDELCAEWKKMRDKNYTYENICDYFVNRQILNIGERQYNLNMYAKYIPFYKQYSHMMHGTLVEHFKRWVKERFIYLDSYFGYESAEIATSITVRVNKSVGATSPMSITLKTYSPQYVRIRWRNAEGATGENTLYEQKYRIGRNEAVTFTMDMPDVTDQEVLIFNAPQLKDIGDLTSLRPSVLLLSNATKLTRLECRNSELLRKVELSSNKMIQYVDLSGCAGLGADQSGTSLDVTNCSNLKYLNVYGTSLLAVNTNTNGGNIEEIYYPYTIQSVQMVKQTNLKTLGIPYKIGTLNAYNFGNSNIYCTDLNEIYLEECPYLDKIGINKGSNSGYDHKNMLVLSNVRSVTFKNSMNSIKYFDFSNCRRLETLNITDMYNIEELKLNDLQYLGLDLPVLYSLKNVNLSNCPSLHTIEMCSDQNYDGLKASCVFAQGTTLDLSRCSALKTIKSNYGIEGLKKIILPTTVENLIFEGSEERVSDIETIHINDIHSTDGFVGIDLQELQLKDFCMESLVKVPKVLNLNITSHNYTPAINMIRDNVTYPYISPECTINLDEYKGNSLRGLYKGITGTGNGTFNVIISDENELPTVKDVEGMFQDTDLSEEETKRLYNKVFNIENASRMFKNNSNLSSLAVFYSNIVNAKEMFYNCVNLRRATFNLSSVLEECGQMFMGCKNLIQCPEVITDSVMNCEQMFYNCPELVTGPRKLGNSVQSCKQMFSECIKLERAVEDIVPSVTTCQHMFNNCFELLEAPLTLGGTNSKVSSCVRMFYECGKLVEAPSEIPNNVTTCAEMFVNCKSLVSGPIKIGTSVNSCVNMFNGCISLETVPESIPDNVTLCGSMFKECRTISDAPAYLGNSISNMNNMFENSGIRTCPDIPSSVKHMQYTFKGCTNLLEAPELSPIATNGVDMFKGCTSLVSTPSVIPASFTGIQNMFEGCTSLVTTKFSVIPSTINTENGAEAVFKGCTSLVAGPSIIESGVIDTASMFEGCESLTATPSNLGSTIIEMNNMFKDCSSLVQLAFKELPATARNLSSMFEGCKLLKSGPSNLSVAATDCSSMFRNCSSLLYTSDFASGTSLLTNCNNMYQKCISITQSSRIPDCVLSVNNMFNGCENLITLANNGIRATTHNNFLTGCTSLTTIREFNLTNFTNPLHASYFGSGANACSKLANITFIGSVRIPLNLGFTDNLTTIPTFESMVNALDQRTASSTLNLTISETSQKNLTTSQKATIASKYWTVSTPEY